jgi:hypothetical protein
MLHQTSRPPSTPLFWEGQGGAGSSNPRNNSPKQLITQALAEIANLCRVVPFARSRVNRTFHRGSVALWLCGSVALWHALYSFF